MNPRVNKVKPNNDFTLELEFANGEIKLFVAKPYLQKGIFTELQDIYLFNMVKVFDGTV